MEFIAWFLGFSPTVVDNLKAISSNNLRKTNKFKIFTNHGGQFNGNSSNLR